MKVALYRPTAWALVMRYDLFWELTAFWPCSYLTNNCSAASTSKILVTTGREQIDMRDEMRSGNFLWINGIRVPMNPKRLSRFLRLVFWFFSRLLSWPPCWASTGEITCQVRRAPRVWWLA